MYHISLPEMAAVTSSGELVGFVPPPQPVGLTVPRRTDHTIKVSLRWCSRVS